MKVSARTMYYGFVAIVAAFVAGVFLFADKATQLQVPLEAVAPNVSPFSEYYRATVLGITEEYTNTAAQIVSIQQTVLVRFRDVEGRFVDKEVRHEIAQSKQKLAVGDRVVLARAQQADVTGGAEFYIVDMYRLPLIGWFALAFVILAIIFGKWRGLTSLVGLAFSLTMLLYFLTPQVLVGQNPALVAFITALFIAVISMYTAHGFNRRTTLSVISTVVLLCVVQGLSWVAVSLFKLYGTSTEETALLLATINTIDLQGLLLAGIVIGTLGILDDITTAQTAAVEELHLVDPNASLNTLYRRGMSIGKEHISSLINTLVLAYAGAFLPLFLIITVNYHQPIWTIINSQFISEEIARTLVGSMALVLAVPLATVLAAWYVSRKK